MKTLRRENGEISLQAIDQYMREVGWQERLGQEEEERLLQVLERAKCCPADQWLAMRARSARDRLVEGYQPLVISLAKRFARWCEQLELMDLIQEGNLGVIEAIERNEASKGYPLRALVSTCVYTALVAACRHQEGGVSLGVYMQGLVTRVYRAQEKLLGQLGREPSLAEVAREVGMSERKVREVRLFGGSRKVESLQGLLGEQGEEDHQTFVGLYQGFLQGQEERERGLEQALQEALQTALSERQREVIEVRYGLGEGGPQTQEGTARMLGMRSAKNVQYQEYCAKRRLREVLASRYRVDHEEIAS